MDSMFLFITQNLSVNFVLDRVPAPMKGGMHIPRVRGWGFSTYAAAGKVSTGFLAGNTDQLRIISEPVIRVQDISFRDIVSRSSSSMTENCDGWGDGCCLRPSLVVCARSDRTRP